MKIQKGSGASSAYIVNTPLIQTCTVERICIILSGSKLFFKILLDPVIKKKEVKMYFLLVACSML